MKRRRVRPYRPPVSDDSGVYGFDWGPLRVIRLGHVPGRGWWLHVSTERQSLEIQASDAGQRLRVTREQPPRAIQPPCEWHCPPDCGRPARTGTT